MLPFKYWPFFNFEIPVDTIFSQGTKASRKGVFCVLACLHGVSRGCALKV